MKIRGTFSIDEKDWINLEETAKKLGYESRNKLIASMVKNILYGDDIKSEFTIKEKLEDEKLKKIQFENKELAEIKKRNLEAHTKIAEYHADNLNVLGSNPSGLAKKAMEYHVTDTKPYDKDAIYCPDCKWCTNSKDSIQFQIDRITDHVRIIHHRSFTEEEAKIISELLV